MFKHNIFIIRAPGDGGTKRDKTSVMRLVGSKKLVIPVIRVKKQTSGRSDPQEASQTSETSESKTRSSEMNKHRG